MISSSHICSLTEFQRNAKEHIERLKKTGKPEVLTGNGNAEVVVQSPNAYQQLVEDAELARSLRVIRANLDDAKHSRVQPAKEFIENFTLEHGIKLDGSKSRERKRVKLIRKK
jgi:PHD/YefM family antitoxin component YafN of YafNO toxin-antitoxin module